jgi:hypothetical protein
MSPLFIVIPLLLTGTSAFAKDSYYRQTQRNDYFESCLDDFEEEDTDLPLSKQVRFCKCYTDKIINAFTDDELEAIDDLDADILEEMENKSGKYSMECLKTLR